MRDPGSDPTRVLRKIVCANAACGAENPVTYRFCMKCGTSLAGIRDPEEVATPPSPESIAPVSDDLGDTLKLSSPTDWDRVYVTRILPSDGTEVYALGREFVVGRDLGHLTIPDDRLLSAEHCSIRRDGQGYVLKDLDSSNGTFARVKIEAELSGGDEFIMGGQVFRWEVTPADGSNGGGKTFTLVRVLDGGRGSMHYPITGLTTIGREGADIEFPEDHALSPVHGALVPRGPASSPSRFLIRDEGSRNGIYFRLRREKPLELGDMFAAGHQLFRFDESS